MARKNQLALRADHSEEITLRKSPASIVAENERLAKEFTGPMSDALTLATLQAYRSYARRFVAFLGIRELRTATFADVMDFLGELETRDVQAASLDAAVSALRRFLLFAGNEAMPANGNWARLKARYTKDHPLGDGLEGLTKYLAGGSTETLSRFDLQLAAEAQDAQRELRESAHRWARIEAKRLVVSMIQRAKNKGSKLLRRPQ